MRRRLAFLSMFLFFGLAYVTLDRLPRTAASVVRGGAEHVARPDRAEAATGPVD